MILRIKNKKNFYNLKNPMKNLIFVFLKNSNDFDNIEKKSFFFLFKDSFCGQNGSGGVNRQPKYTKIVFESKNTIQCLNLLFK